MRKSSNIFKYFLALVVSVISARASAKRSGKAGQAGIQEIRQWQMRSHYHGNDKK